MGQNIGPKSSKSIALTLRWSTNEYNAKHNKRPWGGENVLEHLSMKLNTDLQYFTVFFFSLLHTLDSCELLLCPVGMTMLLERPGCSYNKMK